MITLLTDFGTRDSYVAEMKAVILRLNPQAAIVDITHEIEPQAVAEGAVVLGRAFSGVPHPTRCTLRLSTRAWAPTAEPCSW